MIELTSTYAQLPERFFAQTRPSSAGRAELIRLNPSLATNLGLDADWLSSSAGLSFLAAGELQGAPQPLAMAYAGHQFGHFVPSLGDGRAVLLGEVEAADGNLYDLHLKGSGKTPFSRGGDGNAALGPVLREYVVSEAMAALGVPTTRALAALSTGDLVYRETALAGARLVRVARSHVRVGTFQYFAARGDVEALDRLTHYVIERLYPELADAERPALALLEAVIARQADLIAHWQSIGFIHGVMNTDNMSIAGETIDYGPCAFMDAYRAAQVYSSIDRHGRYAYRNQPGIGQWNLAMLAQSLLPLIDPDEDKAIELAQAAVDTYPALFERGYIDRFRAKLGLVDSRDGDKALIDDLLAAMEAGGADFTLTFRHLSGAIDVSTAEIMTQFSDPSAFTAWAGRWRERMALEDIGPEARRAAMDAVNPLYIPRNHQVEAVIAAAYGGDMDPFHRLVEVLSQPFSAQQGCEAYARPPQPDEIVQRTFCGT